MFPYWRYRHNQQLRKLSLIHYYDRARGGGGRGASRLWEAIAVAVSSTTTLAVVMNQVEGKTEDNSNIPQQQQQQPQNGARNSGFIDGETLENKLGKSSPFWLSLSSTAASYFALPNQWNVKVPSSTPIFQSNKTLCFFGRNKTEETSPATMPPPPPPPHSGQHPPKSYTIPSAATKPFATPTGPRLMRRSQTIAQLNSKVDKSALESRYKVNWRRPLGEGAFGAVFLGSHRQTGERVAIKKISKKFTKDSTFQREIGALFQIRANGGHPNICGLRENFEDCTYNYDNDTDDGYFYLVLDLVAGGEMFEHLCHQGAYSEADAARLIREVASAMNFMHGIGIVHGDMKPENLMLSHKETASAVVKVVDFGCAQLQYDEDDDNTKLDSIITPAYSAPEVLKINREKKPIKVDPSYDMWAVGVILYIMLTGVHPFDLYGNSSEKEIEDAILSGKRPPSGNAQLTAHLSADAISVIEKLLMWDPSQRLTAQQLLEDPWVRGVTARTSKMAFSDKRLHAYQAFKTKLQAKAFADMVSVSAGAASGALTEDPVSKRTSLIEGAFQKFERDNRGYIPVKELRKFAPDQIEGIKDDAAGLSLSSFHNILSDSMQDRYYPRGHVIYNEGEIGHAMFFLESGSIEVSTKDGFRSVRNSGEFFGEGALLHPKKIRSATIRCLTPVHAIEISREYFEKYSESDEGVKVNLREHDRERKRERAKVLLQLQQNTTERQFEKGQYLFKKGELGNEVFVISEGTVVVQADGQDILDVSKGEIAGEHSTVFRRPRNVEAKCITDKCQTLVLPAYNFAKLLKRNEEFNESVREICLRREFQKAICFKSRKSFPKDEKELRETFDLLANENGDAFDYQSVRALLKEFDPLYTEQDMKDIVKALNMNDSGIVTWLEFRRIFGFGMESPLTPSPSNSKYRRREKWKRGGG